MQPIAVGLRANRKLSSSGRAAKQRCCRKAIHWAEFIVLELSPRYLKILLLRNCGAGGDRCNMGAWRDSIANEAASLAVSLVRDRSVGKRLYHKKVVGTVERYPDETAVRRAVVGLLSEINADVRPTSPRAITIAQLCDHFEQRELSKENTWRSHATKRIYKAYLTRWVRPHWHKYELAEVRTIQVESWLRGLALAKSSCAKIRNLMSVLFNHACRYELLRPQSDLPRSSERKAAQSASRPDAQ